MLDLISEAIEGFLEKKGLNVSQISYEDLVDRQVGSISEPKINVSISSGTFPKILMHGYKMVPVISLILMVQNMRGEKERKFAAYRLMNGVVNALLLEKLDLELQDALKPVSFAEVTDEEFNAAGYSLYQLDFTCSFNYTKEYFGDDQELELEDIISKYYLEDGTLGSTGSVITNEINGGGAWSNDFIETITGGHAGTKEFIEEIYGGNAESTYGA